MIASTTRSAKAALAGALALAALALPASASADGNLNLTVNAAGGTGTVTSTSVSSLAFLGGTVTAMPGEIDCDEGGGPVCAANFDETFNEGAIVTLSASPGPGSVFGGWSFTPAAGASFARCTTPPQANPTCQVTLSGSPGPTASVSATFVPAPELPATTTLAASAVGERFATMHGQVNPRGNAVDDCYFQYGTTAAYGATVPCVPPAAGLGSGSGALTVSATTEALEPGVDYHFRLVASNVTGEAFGADRAFATTGEPLCENVERRVEQGIASILLPDCMALEMVSPPKKLNQRASLPTVSVDGNRVRFDSNAALAGTPNLQNLNGDLYVASRDEEAGWSTQYTSPPAGVRIAEANSFDPSFSCWFYVPAASDVQVPLGEGQAFRGCLGGLYSPLSPLLVPLAGGVQETLGGTQIRGASADHSRLYFKPGPLGTRTTAYLPGDPVPAGTGQDWNTYVALLDSAGQPSLALLARDTVGADAGKAWGGNCGSRLGGIGRVTGPENTALNGERNQGAISPDGSRVYLSARAAQPQSGNCTEANKMRILERLEDSAGQAEIRELIPNECDPACGGSDGDDLYQGASVDQSKVYFTTNRRLTNSDLDGSATQCSISTAVAGCDLYLLDRSKPPGQRLTQVSAGEDVGGHQAGKEARVLNGITAISTDGARAYFVAEGVLTAEPNPSGATPQAGAGSRNLYVWDAEAEELAFVGALASNDGGNNGALWGSYGGTFGNRAYPVPAFGQDADGNEVGGDGRVLLFESNAALTGDDLDGNKRDIFRYDAAADPPTLIRVSKAMPGGADNGNFDVRNNRGLVTEGGGGAAGGSRSRGGVGTDAAVNARWVSEDGESVVFSTGENLVPGDRSGATFENAYLWRKGQLVLLPGTTVSLNANNRTEGSTPTVSPDGKTVAFVAIPQLLAADGDTINDVYVARVDGGFEHVVPSTCGPDGEAACQGPAPLPPAASTPVIDGAGNPVPRADCGAIAKNARQLRRRAARLRGQARRAKSARQTRRLRGQARRLTRRANGLNRNAQRCRRANRRAAR